MAETPSQLLPTIIEPSTSVFPFSGPYAAQQVTALKFHKVFTVELPTKCKCKLIDMWFLCYEDDIIRTFAPHPT
ncbi:unnamed protein product [Dovyalis caffra]|uniref:Uncharacterized protein n=1 Tax=Dovyalis caffra TaxID=77055 RepID=A0AAV1QUT6_9ROSI|nr:unnamed protein product [Dovyalis caffra]